MVVLGRVQNDRFSGGLRLTVQQVWDLAAARCRFGKYLRVDVNGQPPPVAEVLRDFPSRRAGEASHSLALRLHIRRERAACEVDLGDEARFYPSDAALERWRESARGGSAQVVYD